MSNSIDCSGIVVATEKSAAYRLALPVIVKDKRLGHGALPT
jgi:hypothetical protein